MWIDLHRVYANVDIEYQDLLTSSGDGEIANHLSRTIPSDATSALESLFPIGFHTSIGIPIYIGILITHRIPHLHRHPHTRHHSRAHRKPHPLSIIHRTLDVQLASISEAIVFAFRAHRTLGVQSASIPEAIFAAIRAHRTLEEHSASIPEAISCCHPCISRVGICC